MERVSWIFTDQKSVLIADQSEDWHIISWAKDFEILEGLSVNIANLIEDMVK